MTRGRRFYATVSLLVLFFGVALNSFAAEEAGGPPSGGSEEIFKWINFAIVAGVVIWVFAKKLPSSFQKNAEAISSAITKATAAKEAAERQMREAETKLANLEREIAALRAAAEKEAADEAERIRAVAKSDAAKVGVAAEAEIEAEERAARMELKALAASLAVDGAESLLAKQLTATAHENLVDSFVTSLDGRPN